MATLIKYTVGGVTHVLALARRALGFGRAPFGTGPFGQ